MKERTDETVQAITNIGERAHEIDQTSQGVASNGAMPSLMTEVTEVANETGVNAQELNDDVGMLSESSQLLENKGNQFMISVD